MKTALLISVICWLAVLLHEFYQQTTKNSTKYNHSDYTDSYLSLNEISSKAELSTKKTKNTTYNLNNSSPKHLHNIFNYPQANLDSLRYYNQSTITATHLTATPTLNFNYEHKTTRQVFESTNFTLFYSNHISYAAIEDIAAEIEMQLSRFVNLYEFDLPRDPLVINIYNKNNYYNLEIIKEHPWIKSFYNGHINLLVTSDEHQQISIALSRLTHELVHALLAEKTNNTNLPYWLEEGLSQYLTNNSTFSFPATPGNFFESKRFYQPFIKENYNLAQRLYNQSHYIVLNLINSFGPASITDIITSLNKRVANNVDKILEPVAITFNELYTITASNWKKRLNITQ